MSSFRRTLSLARRGIRNYFLRRPFCVSFEVTYRCNARCKHCHLGGPADERRATPRKYAERCREIQPVVAQVSGGEPLLRKDLEEIVAALRIPDSAPYIVVTTNGVLLDRERYFSLRKAGVDEFSLSLDYPDERHDEFRGVPGLFARIQNLIQELAGEEDGAITLSCVIQSDNFRALPLMVELARRWKVKLNFSTYTSLRTRNTGYLIARNEVPEFKRIVQKLLDLKRKHKNIYTSDYALRKMVKFFEMGAVGGCPAGEKFMVVNPDATLSPCGLVIKEYETQKEMIKDFRMTNTCGECYTSIRANTEKPAWYLIKDSLHAIR